MIEEIKNKLKQLSKPKENPAQAYLDLIAQARMTTARDGAGDGIIIVVHPTSWKNNRLIYTRIKGGQIIDNKKDF